MEERQECSIYHANPQLHKMSTEEIGFYLSTSQSPEVILAIANPQLNAYYAERMPLSETLKRMAN